MNSCSKRAQGQGGPWLTLLSSSGYFAPGCGDSRDHGSLWRGAGHPHCSTLRRKPTGAQHQTVPKLLSASSGKRQKHVGYIQQPPAPDFCPKTPPLVPIAYEVLDADSTGDLSFNLISFHALLSELHTGITSNNT